MHKKYRNKSVINHSKVSTAELERGRGKVSVNYSQISKDNRGRGQWKPEYTKAHI